MKWLFYVIVLVYMFYRAVYGAKAPELSIVVDTVSYGDDNFLKAGEHKTINCKPSTRSQKVEWMYPNGTLVKRISSNRVFSQEHFVQAIRGRVPAHVLTITRALVEDTGVYKCRSGNLTEEVSLCVIEPSEFIGTATEVIADIGRSITLTCQAKGDPEPRLVWNRNGETITDDDSSAKYRVMTKYNIQGFEGLLTITSLEPEDSGIYSCVSIQESIQVEDCNNTNTANITLNVNYVPVFENGNETNIYGKNYQELDIVCSANGFPAPTYTWYRELPDDTLFKFDKKAVKFSEEDNQAVLSVTAGSATFGQRYKCEATNDQGTSEKYFTLLRMEKPSRVDKVVLYDASDNTAQLNVTWDHEITFPVTAFVVQFVEEENENRKRYYLKDVAWKNSQETEVKLSENEILHADLGSIIVTVPGLEKETSYWMRLRPKNEVGEPAWSEPVFVSTSTEEETEGEEEETTITEAPTEEELSIDDDSNMNDATFYGIFFAGGIFVVAFVCMFAMRLVK